MKRRDRYLEGENEFYSAALRAAVNPGDRLVLIFTVTFWLAVIFALTAATNWLVLLVVALLMLYTYLHVRHHMATMLGIAYHVQSGKQSMLYQLVKEVSRNLNVGHVEVFILKDATPKLQTTGSFGHFEIVLDAETVEAMTEAELRALLIHEMSYVAFRSATLAAHIRPIAEKIKIPGLSFLINWIFGFWSRRIALTGDRLALFCTRDPHALMMALVKVQIGGYFAPLVEEDSLLLQNMQLGSLRRRMGEGSHDYPYLTTRLAHIIRLCQQYQIPLPPRVTLLTDAARQAGLNRLA